MKQERSSLPRRRVSNTSLASEVSRKTLDGKGERWLGGKIRLWPFTFKGRYGVDVDRHLIV